jgi:transcriptional regulator with XRE-family HTH domain
VVDIDTLAQERGARLKHLRKATGLSRREFFGKFGISVGTLQNWESPRSGGLSDAGARRIIACLASEDVHVGFEWLMYGAGQPPQMSLPKRFALLSQRANSRCLEKEVDCFQRHNKGAAVLVLKEECLAPKFNKGDCLFGVLRKTNNTVKGLVGLLCIVELVNGERHAGYLQKISLSRRSVKICLPNSADFPVANNVFGSEEVFNAIWQVVAVSRAESGSVSR